MATLSLAPNPWFTGFDDLGAIVPHGLLFTYASGSSTKQATYTDVGGLVANANPIVLDSAGRVPSGLYLLPLSYKFVLSPANDTDPPTNPIRSQDAIGAVPTSNTGADITITAGENLAAEAVAYMAVGTEGGTVAGKFYNTTASVAAKSSSALTVVMVPTAIASGMTGTGRLQGDVTVTGPLTPGAAYYISSSSGLITTTAPVFTRYVGQAKSTTVITVTPNGSTGNSGLDLIAIEALLG